MIDAVNVVRELLRRHGAKIRALLSDAQAAADRLEIELVQQRARVEYLEGLLERVYNGPGRFGLPRELRDEIAGNIPKAPAARRSG
jgi:hypothetical protein